MAKRAFSKFAAFFQACLYILQKGPFELTGGLLIYDQQTHIWTDTGNSRAHILQQKVE